MAEFRSASKNDWCFMIPYGRHKIDQADIESVIDVLRSDWLTGGLSVNAFEQILEHEVQAKHAVACSNGTTALHLAMLALDIGPGDTVLVPAITFLASANAARYVGADVVFVDIDPNTGLMTADTLQSAILENKNKRLKAVVNVHLAGQCENLEKIQNVAKQHGLLIIEDAAHAIGTIYTSNEGKAHPIGANAFSDITIFSFHPVKTIAVGEGGAVTTNSAEIAEKLKCYRSHSMLRSADQWEEKENIGPWYYEMHNLGYNYRLSDINCALGISQLRKIQDFKKIRQDMANTYNEAFKGLLHTHSLVKLNSSDTAWHLYILLIDFEHIGLTRSALMNALKEKGIGTQVHYIPLYKQPYYKKLYGSMALPGSEAYYKKCLSIPLYVGLTSDEQSHVMKTVMDYVK